MWMMPLHLHVNQKSDYDMIYDKVFHRGPYRPPSRSNWTHGVQLLLEGVCTTCDFSGVVQTPCLPPPLDLLSSWTAVEATGGFKCILLAELFAMDSTVVETNKKKALMDVSKHIQSIITEKQNKV